MTNTAISEYASTIRNTGAGWRYLSKNECQLIDSSSFTRNPNVEEIRRILLTHGFLTLICPKDVIEMHLKVLEEAEAFFALPINIKESYLYSSIDQKQYGNVGYYPLGKEKAASHSSPDIKEFIHFGQRAVEIGTPYGSYPGNDWLAQRNAFKQALESEYSALERLACALFPVIGEIFGLNRPYLEELTHFGNSILRVIHYPPTSEDNIDAMRAAPHHGMNLMGLQPPSNHQGLQFCTVDTNEWVALPADLDVPVITVNIGRMFSYLTNGRLLPTLHRVINNQGGSERHNRYTGVLFFHGNPEKYLKPIAGKDSLADVLIGEWLLDRLKKIRIRED